MPGAPQTYKSRRASVQVFQRRSGGWPRTRSLCETFPRARSSTAGRRPGLLVTVPTVRTAAPLVSWALPAMASCSAVQKLWRRSAGRRPRIQSDRAVVINGAHLGRVVLAVGGPERVDLVSYCYGELALFGARSTFLCLCNAWATPTRAGAGHAAAGPWQPATVLYERCASAVMRSFASARAALSFALVSYSASPRARTKLGTCGVRGSRIVAPGRGIRDGATP